MSNPKLLQDLSYRSYAESSDYPVWWAIARTQFSTNIRKKWIWLLTTLSAWWYLMLIVITWVFEQILQQGGGSATRGRNTPLNFFDNVVWRDQMSHAFGFGQMFILFLSLVFVAGTVSNDLRANALLVYLSKPCTKMDYLIGKWLGAFLPLLLTISIPHLLFYIYGGLSFHTYGFFKQDPLMILKLLVALPIVAAVYTSLGMAISSLNRHGRIAGIVLAALYFLSNFFTNAVVIAITTQTAMGENAKVPTLLNYLYYGSVDGLGNALYRGIMGYSGSNWAFFGRGMAPGIPAIPVWIPLVIAVGVIVGGVALAYSRIRAVEVV